MRFNDWKTEVVRAKQVVDRLEEGPKRRYLLRRGDGDIFVRIHVWVHSEGDHTVSLFLECREMCSDQHRLLSMLTPQELIWLAEVREAVDEWIAGSTVDLDKEMPWEASLRG